MTNHASKFSFDAFSKMTGGSLERAYEILGGFAAAALDGVVRRKLIRTCPKCNKPMGFQALTENAKGYTGRWICTDEEGEPSAWCGYEELVTAPLEEVIKRYGVAPDDNEPLVDTEKYKDAPDSLFASIYPRIARASSFPKPIADWARRHCPTCGTPMVFYAVKDSENATGVFACPNGWDVSEDPATWCGYEEVVNTPLDELFAEYVQRAPDKQHAARELLLKECPWCGGLLVPRPVEINDRGWKTRWICQKGFTQDDPELLCGYEELTAETVGSYIIAINKIIAESK